MPLILTQRRLEPTRPSATGRRSAIPVPSKSGICHASRPSVSNIISSPAKKLQTQSQEAPTRQRPTLIKHTDAEIPILRLIPFSEQPTVNFGNVRVGTTKFKYVAISNIERIQKQVVVRSMPKADKGFDVDSTDFILAPMSEIHVTLAWSPTVPGSVRETITLQDSTRMASRIIMIGSAHKIEPRPATVRFPRLAKLSAARRPIITPRASPSKLGPKLPLTRLKANSQRRKSGQIVQLMNRTYAANIIQAYWRRYMAQKRVQKVREAIVIIQSRWRATLVRRQLTREREASVILQKRWRGVLARRKLTSMRQSAILIQKSWRGVLARRQVAREREAALVLQKCWRGTLIRRILAQERDAALTIQRNWRGALIRRRVCHLRSAALVIQKNWRATLARRRVCRLRAATLVLQRHWRGTLVRRRATREREAALVLQKTWRAIMARRRAANLRARKEALQRLVLYIQPFCRGHLYRSRLMRSITAVEKIMKAI